MIDEEVRKLIDSAYDRVKVLLREKIKEVTIIAEQLLSKEVLYKDDMVELLGERPFEEHAIIPDLTANGNEEATSVDTTIPPSPESPLSESPNTTDEA